MCVRQKREWAFLKKQVKREKADVSHTPDARDWQAWTGEGRGASPTRGGWAT